MINKDVKGSVRNICQVIALSAAAVLAVAPLAHAENLVTNGSFEDTTPLNGFSAGISGQINYSLLATGWTAPALFGSYAFVFTPGTADVTAVGGGAISQYYPDNVYLWGPNDGSNNGLPATSPDGGNFLADDGSYQNGGPITQVLNGLTAGDTYSVTFWWAAAQQEGFYGATTSGWQVNLGTNVNTAQMVGIDPLNPLPSEGFSGWTQQTFDFTADSTSDTLSFLAQGAPGSTQPPFALLDGVDVEQVTPEPGTWVLMLTGILGALGVMRSRQWMKR